MNLGMNSTDPQHCSEGRGYLRGRQFILLLNVKMPTIVGISTFISTINTTSERLKARNFLILQYFSFNEQLKIRAQLSLRLFLIVCLI